MLLLFLGYYMAVTGQIRNINSLRKFIQIVFFNFVVLSHKVCEMNINILG